MYIRTLILAFHASTISFGIIIQIDVDPLLESANDSQGQRLSVSGSLGKSMEESPEMKTDTHPPVKPVVKERMLVSSHNHACPSMH